MQHQRGVRGRVGRIDAAETVEDLGTVQGRHLGPKGEQWAPQRPEGAAQNDLRKVASEPCLGAAGALIALDLELPPNSSTFVAIERQIRGSPTNKGV